MRPAGTSAFWSLPTKIRRTARRPRPASSSPRARCAMVSRRRFRATPICSSRPKRPRLHPQIRESLMQSLSIVRRYNFVKLAALTSFIATSAFALKYAAPEHHLKVDPAITSWKPGEVVSEPEEALNLVGADVMDEITLGWV